MENLGVPPPSFHAKTGPTRSGLKTDPGEDQAEPSALTTVVRQCPAGVGRHSAGSFRTKTGLTRSGRKTDPSDQAGLPALTTVVRQGPAGDLAGIMLAVCDPPCAGPHPPFARRCTYTGCCTGTGCCTVAGRCIGSGTAKRPDLEVQHSLQGPQGYSSRTGSGLITGPGEDRAGP